MGDFLLKLYMENKRLKSLEAFKNLKETLSEEDLRSIMTSSKEFGVNSVSGRLP